MIESIFGIIMLLLQNAIRIYLRTYNNKSMYNIIINKRKKCGKENLSISIESAALHVYRENRNQSQ